MLYTGKIVQIVFSIVTILTVLFSLNGPQAAAAQGRNKVEDQLDFINYTLLAPGSLDPTFDGDGRVATTFGAENNRGNAIVIQPDGKIIVAGSQRNSNSFADFALARYNTDGSLDSSFGTGGKVIAG